MGKTVRNMKELEKEINTMIKKELPKVTKEYCHKWYRNNDGIREFATENEFCRMVSDSMKVTVHGGKFEAQFDAFQNRDMSEEEQERIKAIWEEFKDGYLDYVKKKLFM